MCVVSMIGDHYGEKWWPKESPYTIPIQPLPDDLPFPKKPFKQYDWDKIFNRPAEVSKKEFDALKKEVEELKELLKRAKKYDEANNEPNCEIEDKMKLLRKVAEAVGINLDEVIGTAK